MKSESGDFTADEVIVCTGAHTAYLIPELQNYMRVTGHPVFHFSPESNNNKDLHSLPVFAADISNSGWYGFPPHPESGVVKIANHGLGKYLDPRTDKRETTSQQKEDVRQFIEKSMRGLKGCEMTTSHLCYYTDSFDGHFWIDRHPDFTNLTIATGGSGHAFKMAPLLGTWISAMALGDKSGCPSRFHWRELPADAQNMEEARFKPPSTGSK